MILFGLLILDRAFILQPTLTNQEVALPIRCTRFMGRKTRSMLWHGRDTGMFHVKPDFGQ